MTNQNMSSTNKMLHIVGSFLAIIFALIYISTQIDLVPATIGGIGILDDAIIFLLFIYFAWKLWTRTKQRVNEGRKQGLWSQGKIFKALTKPKTWLAILILIGAILYFQWSWATMPISASIGYVDRVIVTIAAAISVIKLTRGN